MILYHYTSLDIARKILTSTQIGFSRSNFFNDPFDKPVATPVVTDNPVSGMFANINAKLKSTIWEKETAILSLTRSPTNALMWAHYADRHRGAVLEINAHLAGFTDIKCNMIPAHFGSVTYSHSRPTGPLISIPSEGVAVGATHDFVLSHYEKWQRLFLTKPLEWAYEEEVRVVKCLKGLDSVGSSSNESGDCEIIYPQGRPLHCFRIPKDAITRIIVGVRTDEAAVGELDEEHSNVSVCRAELDDARFEIRLRHSSEQL